MCAPRWDSDAVFSALLGGPGGYSITPVDRFVWGGYYEEGSMIWRSRWVTNHGIIECREALAFPGDPHRAVLLRRVIAVDGDAEVRITLAPRAGFGRHDLTQLHDADGIWTGRSGPLHLRWTGAPASTRPVDRHDGLIAGLLVPAGGHHDLILEISDQALPDQPPDPDAAWDATDTAWAAAVPDLDNCLEPQGCPPVLRGAARVDLGQRRDGRRRHHQPARNGPRPAATTTTGTSGSVTSATPARPPPRPARPPCSTTRSGSSPPGSWTTGPT